MLSRERRREVEKAYLISHPERVEAKRRFSREWYKRNKKYCTEQAKLWAEIHPEKVRQAKRAWKVSNPEVVRAGTRNRRAIRKNALGSHTATEIRDLYELQAHRCYWCTEELTEYHVDHFVPLAKGGSNGINNLVLACPSCNCRKGAKDPTEMLRCQK